MSAISTAPPMILSGSIRSNLPSCSSTDRREALPDSGGGPKARPVRGAPSTGHRLPGPGIRAALRRSEGRARGPLREPDPPAERRGCRSRERRRETPVRAGQARARRAGEAGGGEPVRRRTPGQTIGPASSRVVFPTRSGDDLPPSGGALLDNHLRLGGRLRLEELHREHAVGIEGLDLVVLDLRGQPDRPQEPALLPLLPEVILALLFLVELPLAGQGEQISLDFHVEVVAGHA